MDRESPQWVAEVLHDYATEWFRLNDGRPGTREDVERTVAVISRDCGPDCQWRVVEA